eukprot:UN12765
MTSLTSNGHLLLKLPPKAALNITITTIAKSIIKFYSNKDSIVMISNSIIMLPAEIPL